MGRGPIWGINSLSPFILLLIKLYFELRLGQLTNLKACPLRFHQFLLSFSQHQHGEPENGQKLSLK